MTSISDPLVGHLLDKRYEITARLARGGMATVYLATDLRLTRTVAVKVMHVGLGDDTDFARKFDREARAAARLSHPNVVSVFDQGHDSGRPYIVMEYVDGLTLRDVITADTPLPPLRALEVIEPVLMALGAAHEAGLVHRDVKPENVLISERGQTKVADFGLAKAITAQTSTATQGMLIGTVSYLPPELVLTGRSDPRSDVYSAGVVLFELLTGRKPHTGDTPIQVAYAHVHTDVPPPSEFATAGSIPPYLDALLARVTARDPHHRPPDAKVMLTQVRRVRAALREGAADDPALTQDLEVPPPAAEHHQPVENPTEGSADTEVTEFVSSAQLVEAPSETWSSIPPTAIDAPPAGARPFTPAVSGERTLRLQRRQRRRRRRGFIALLLVLTLAAAAAVAGWYVTEGRFTTTPALTALTEDEAVATAAGAGLNVTFDTAFSESVKQGLVISTSPGPGTRILDGGEILATVSRGPQRFGMPKVTGLPQSKAIATVEKSQLTVGTITPKYHEKVAAGVVLGASQKPGAKLKGGTTVDLTISRGPKPITITSFVGKPAGPATKALKKAGFKVKRTTANSDSVKAGNVIKQTPAKGSGKAGDTSKLTVSSGPVMVTVPEVTAMGLKAATAVMQKAGFTVKTARASVNYLGLQYVAYSDPKARSKAPRGSTVTLYLV